MTDITQRLIQLDGQLQIHNEGDWSNTTSDYSAFNDAGVECEVGEFLYGLTQLIKPEHVLETGTHWGIGASYMGLGILDNGKGKLDTIEFLPEIHQVASKRIQRIGLEDVVKCHLMDAKLFEPECFYDLILLDTEPQIRFAELVKFEPFLNAGGYLFIHDLHRHMGQVDNPQGFGWPYGRIPSLMDDLIKTQRLRPFHFTNPRGFTGFYKPHPQDYYYT